jgi:hypothetical protein
MKAILLQRISRKITRPLNISRSSKYKLRKCTVLFGHNILRILRDKERVTGIAGNSTQGDIGERKADADARLEKQDYRGTAPPSTEKSCRSMSKAKFPYAFMESKSLCQWQT